MNRLKLVILLIFAFSMKLSAQNVKHLCVGDHKTFWVPDNPTSSGDFTNNIEKLFSRGIFINFSFH